MIRARSTLRTALFQKEVDQGTVSESQKGGGGTSSGGRCQADDLRKERHGAELQIFDQ